MALVLARRVGELVTIRGDIFVELADICDSKILLSVQSIQPLAFEFPDTTIDAGEGKFWLVKEDKLTINKYFKVRFNELKGAKIVLLGFEAPKNIIINRLELGDNYEHGHTVD